MDGSRFDCDFLDFRNGQKPPSQHLNKPNKQQTTNKMPKPYSPRFDLRSYISRYDSKSETRIQRLLFLARNGESPKLAYSLLEQQLKQAGNVRRYQEVFGSDGDYDMEVEGDRVGVVGGASTAAVSLDESK